MNNTHELKAMMTNLRNSEFVVYLVKGQIRKLKLDWANFRNFNKHVDNKTWYGFIKNLWENQTDMVQMDNGVILIAVLIESAGEQITPWTIPDTDEPFPFG